MIILSSLIVGLVALLHFYFLILEMFFWTRPLGLKTFGNSQEKANASKVLAANQGLYNGFLSAGLIWGLMTSDPTQSSEIKIFFLSCVVIAGIYGALSVKPKIFFIQSLPAIFGIAAIIASS